MTPEKESFEPAPSAEKGPAHEQLDSSVEGVSAEEAAEKAREAEDPIAAYEEYVLSQNPDMAREDVRAALEETSAPYQEQESQLRERIRSITKTIRGSFEKQKRAAMIGLAMVCLNTGGLVGCSEKVQEDVGAEETGTEQVENIDLPEELTDELSESALQERYNAYQEQSQELSAEAQELANRLSEMFGEDRINVLLSLESAQSPEERDQMLEQMREMPEMNLEGIQQLDDLNQSERWALLEKIVPDSVAYNIESVQVKDWEAMRELQQTGSGRPEGVIPSSVNDAGTEWSIYPPVADYFSESETQGYFQFYELAFHEFAHMADWARNELLTPEERLELLNQVVERVQSDNRYSTPYIDNISEENLSSPDADNKDVLYAQALEYWGEIFKAYYWSPDELPNEDKQLVESVIEKAGENGEDQRSTAVSYSFIVTARHGNIDTGSQSYRSALQAAVENYRENQGDPSSFFTDEEMRIYNEIGQNDQWY